MLISLSMCLPHRRPNKTGSRTAPKCFLGDSQWNLIKDLFPMARKSHPDGGLPIDSRACLEGIIRVLKTGARWKDSPDRYSSAAICWRRYKVWTESGVIEKAWQRLLKRMSPRKLMHWSQAIGYGTFSPAKKGMLMLVRPGGARAARSWSMVRGFPYRHLSPVLRLQKSARSKRWLMFACAVTGSGD